jgi:hypothetical protein
MHGRVGNAYNGSISDIDSEKYVNLRHYFDSFRHRERQTPPLKLHAPLLHFEAGQVEEGMVPSVTGLYSLGQVVGVCVIAESCDGYSGRQV